MLKVQKIELDNNRVAYLGYENNKLEFHIKQDFDHNWIIKKDSIILYDDMDLLIKELDELASI